MSACLRSFCSRCVSLPSPFRTKGADKARTGVQGDDRNLGSVFVRGRVIGGARPLAN